MKKKNEPKIWIAATVFMALMVTSAFAVLAIGVVSATTWYVEEGESIHAAVDAAKDGDAIIVRDGIYIENVDVNKRLTIQSENGSASTIIQEADSYYYAFEVTADYVNISGFTLEGSINLRQSSNSKLTGNAMVESGIFIMEGWLLSHYTHEIDESNTVNGKPVYYWNGIEGGKVPDGAGQVILVDCKDVVVENQNLNDTRVGVEVAFSSNITVRNNDCSDNWDGISIEWSSDNNISNNNVHDNGVYGIISHYSSNNKLTGNVMTENGIWVAGYLLSHHIHEIDESNTVNGKPVYYWKNTEGGRVPDGAGQVILVDCNNVVVENQNLSDATTGVQVAFSSNITIRNNDCSENTYGIYLDSSNNGAILNNDCSFCPVGIYLIYSDNNSISENNCSSNHWGAGIYLHSSNNNLIYLNNFINDGDSVHSSMSTNIWNSTSKMTYTHNGSTYSNYLGNYWGDYKEKYPEAEEIDECGIWDTPYSINSDNDSYPLMEPWENYFMPTENIFDTGAPSNPYPSIFGTHNGTITPSKDITVHKLYTYPCAGTGGHTGYAKIWNLTWNATATWKGYTGDWHNITFDKTVVLLANENYYYTIKTGSYPQIHHIGILSTSAGIITCQEFVDANGKKYNDWIPAIMLW